MMKHQLRLSPIVGAVVMALAAPVAMAAVPAANSLPGTFYTNVGTATYNSSAANTATIGINTAGPVVLQWGGSSATANTSIPAPKGITTNAGFDIGAGANLGIDNASSGAAVLINDITGQPSQIYGGLSATNASLFVANGNGIVVGSGATITAPTGIALIGYAQSDSAFNTAGGVTVDGATSTNAGTVTVAPGTIGTGTAGFLLVAGAGTVNVGASAAAGSNLILAGTGFTANSTGITAIGSAVQTASVLNLSGTLTPTSLAAAGNVNVAAGSNLNLTTTATTIGGAFSNSGSVNAGVAAGTVLKAGSILNAGTVTAGALTATGTAGIVNNGIINASAGGLTLTATNTAGAVITNTGVLKNITGALAFDASGTATNNGTIDFNNNPGANTINIQGANVTFNGTVSQVSTGTTPSALSSTNSLLNVTMATPSTSAGVVNLGSSLFFTGTGTELSGAAVRVVSGGLVGSAGGTLAVDLGSGKVGSYGYNLSLFPGTTLAAGTVTVTGSSGSNINLDGVLGNSNATSISVTGGNINASSNGGFAVSSAGAALGLTFYGNLNNPNGSAVAGKPASDFQYNYVPVNVASSGTVTVNLTPESTTTTAQNVNMLVNGSVTLTPSALNTPTLPTSVGGSYINNHLVVQATKNITVGGYWPGLVYLGTINAGTPGSLSSAGTITLNGALNNVLPANVSGSGGIFFMSSNPLGGLSATDTVTTNTNSWINFPAGGADLANYYAATNPTSNYFYGAVINSSTPGVIGTQVLPSGDIQGR